MVPCVTAQRTLPATARAPQTDVVLRYSGFRAEVQGLRAVAVLLVVVYHVFVGRVSGGVDIFLLISSFFMTLSFVRKIEGERALDIPRYWLHTFRRLLPLATVTILGTLVLLVLFYPAASVADFRWHGLASAFYLQNWELATASVDYYAADHSTASPFQHFWSLSVQGQVFLLWPLIFGFAWLVRRRTGISSVPILAVCFGLIFAASMIYSVITTETQQAFAYFDTRARLWEFALGSLIALAIPYLHPPRVLRVVLGWSGLVSMVSVGVLVDVQGAFPGWIALWPLLSAAVIIVAGNSGSPAGVDRFLSWGPVVKLGDAAYALYLIHWPLLITYLVIRDRPVADWRAGIVLVVLSVVLAVVVTKYVEEPIRRWRWPDAAKRREALVVVTCWGVVSSLVLSWLAFDGYRVTQWQADAARNNPGAMSLIPGPRPDPDPDAPILPVEAELKEDLPAMGGECPASVALEDPYRSYCYDTYSPEAPERTVYVIGNSHVRHWLPGILSVAEEEDWQVVTYILQGCFYTERGTQPKAQKDECELWYEGADPLTTQNSPDMVFMQGTFSNPGGERWNPAVGDRVRELVDRDIQVVGIRDTPRFSYDFAACVTENEKDGAECAEPHPMLETVDPQLSLAREVKGFAAVDMNNVVCPDGMCRAVIGNVYVYIDSNHLSLTYVSTAIPQFRARLEQALAADGYTL